MKWPQDERTPSHQTRRLVHCTPLFTYRPKTICVSFFCAKFIDFTYFCSESGIGPNADDDALAAEISDGRSPVIIDSLATRCPIYTDGLVDTVEMCVS